MADPRIGKTRAALGEAVLALAGEKPFAEVTISEIAERAGVGYASFFRHYRDKEALLAEVADAQMEDLLALILPALRNEDTLAASIAICRFADEHRLISRALLVGGAESIVRRHIVTRAIGHPALGAIDWTGEVPKELLVTHGVAATLGLISWWLDQGAEISPLSMGAVLDQLVMAPVRQTRR